MQKIGKKCKYLNSKSKVISKTQEQKGRYKLQSINYP